MKIILPLTLLLTLVAANASAGASPAAKCAIAKTKAAGKNAVAQVKCWQKAIAAGDSEPDSACIAAANQKLTDAITKAEAKGGCGVDGDGSTYQAVASQCADDIAGIVPPILSGCYAGVSTVVDDSPFEAFGRVGIDAADYLCEHEFGGHMCTYSELLIAEEAGDFDAISDSCSSRSPAMAATRTAGAHARRASIIISSNP